MMAQWLQNPLERPQALFWFPFESGTVIKLALWL